MKRASLAALVAGVGVLTVVGGIALAAQDRDTLKVPDGLAFSDFKGYEDWAPVAPSQVKDGIKVISANPVMIKAYREGLPANGKEFPDGSKIVKLEWAPVEDKASPYYVVKPGQLMTISLIEKDLKRFPKTHGWAYAQFVYDPATQSLQPKGTGAECGFACHTLVSAQDYIFTRYPER